MKKTGSRAFILSFAFCLSAVLAADRLYSLGQKIAPPTPKIPSKNISLFFKNTPAEPDAASVSGASSARIESAELAELLDLEAENQAFAAAAAAVPPWAEDAPIPIEYAAAEPKRDVLEIPLDQPAEASGPDFMAIPAARPEIKIPIAAATPAVDNPLPAPAWKGEEKKVAAKTEEPAFAGKISDLIPIERQAPRNGAEAIKIAGAASDGAEAGATRVASLGGAANIAAKDIVQSEGFSSSEESGEDSEKPSAWAPMKETADSPWAVAKGAKYPKNKMVLEEFAQADAAAEAKKSAVEGAKVELTDKTAKNLLIPIPENIMEDENLTPHLASGEKNRSLKELADPPAPENGGTTPPADGNGEAEGGEGKGGGGFLSGLKSIFSSSASTPAVSAANADGEGKKEDFFKQITEKIAPKTPEGKDAPQVSEDRIRPSEMRLTFRPNRAEISGQTLRWINAFANKLASDQNVYLEIRLDGAASFALQQKRLNLLQSIIGARADTSRVRVLFAEREPNSFLIRAVRTGGQTR